MTENEYLRAIGKKLLEIKALADMYEEGCEYLSLSILGDHLSVNNASDAEMHYDFFFNAGDNIESGEIRCADCFRWIDQNDEF